MTFPALSPLAIALSVLLIGFLVLCLALIKMAGRHQRLIDERYRDEQ